MITDPATTPNTLKGNFVFSFTVAFIDFILRILYIPNGIFYALLITSCLLPIIGSHEKRIAYHEKQ